MSSGLKTAQAHNAPQVGYYKFTARTPAHLRAIEPLLTSIGFVRIPSFRIKKPQPCRKK